MAVYNFTIVQNPRQPVDFFDVPMPSTWGPWRASFFDRIPFALGEISSSVQLVPNGCHMGHMTTLNCSAVCANSEYMFASPANLWNCVTLATVAIKVTANNITRPQNEQEVNDMFNFGTLEQLHELKIIDRLDTCLRGSCSNFQYGHCSPGLDAWRPGLINATNILDFGLMLQSKYCDGFGAQIDADIAGQGVLISSIIQGVLVLPFCLFFMLGRRFFKTYSVAKDPDEYSQLSSASKAWLIIRKRFYGAVLSSITDLQEAQTIYTGVIAIAAITTYENYMDLSQSVPVLSYIANILAFGSVVSASMFSTVAPQALLQYAGQSSGYNLFFLVIDWILHITIRNYQKVNASSYWDKLRQKSSVSACGNNPGPMVYCKSPVEDYFSNLKLSAVIKIYSYVMDVGIALLIIHWARRFYMPYFKHWMEQPKLKDWFGWASKPAEKCRFLLSMVSVWSCSLIYTSMLGGVILSIKYLSELYRVMYGSGGGLGTWSFGQLVALTVWLPVLSKFVAFLIFGVKGNTEERIGKQYKVQVQAEPQSYVSLAS